MGRIQGGSIIESMRSVGILFQPDSRLFVVDPNDITNFSLQDAIDECVAGNGDVIATMPGGITVTSQVNMNKSGVRLMSLSKHTRNPLVNGEWHAILADAAFTDGPVMKITVPCVIDGIGFAGRDVGATFFAGASLLIGGDADAGPFGVQLKGCRFPKWGLGARIGVSVEGTTDLLIEECTFEGVGSDLDIGVYVQGATQNLTIRNNHFRQITEAIAHGAFAGGGPHCLYERNFVEDGKVLGANGFSATGFIVDNFSELVAASAYDADVATLQGLGLQLAGNHYKE